MSKCKNGASDTVGYKNPPKSTRFKKGASGNPKGRPKKATLDPTLEHVNLQMTHMMMREHTFTENGVQKSLPYFVWMMKRLQADAMKGDKFAIKTLMTWFLDHLEDRRTEKLEFLQTLIDTEYSVDLEKGSEFLHSRY